LIELIAGGPDSFVDAYTERVIAAVSALVSMGGGPRPMKTPSEIQALIPGVRATALSLWQAHAAWGNYLRGASWQDQASITDEGLTLGGECAAAAREWLNRRLGAAGRLKEQLWEFWLTDEAPNQLPSPEWAEIAGEIGFWLQ
jgi:hypothetical protein